MALLSVVLAVTACSSSADSSPPTPLAAIEERVSHTTVESPPTPGRKSKIAEQLKREIWNPRPMNEWSDDEIRRMGGMVEVHWRANGEVEEILHEGNVQNIREAIERDLRGERYRASPTEPTRFQRVLATDLLYTSPEAEPNSSQIRLNKGTVVFGTDDRSYVNHTTNQGWTPPRSLSAFRTEGPAVPEHSWVRTLSLLRRTSFTTFRARRGTRPLLVG